MERHFVSQSVTETIALGKRLAEALPLPAVLFLEGDLGAGKTHFAKGLYLGMGGANDRDVVSPSYTLIHEYPLPRGKMYHVDLYRLENPDHVLGLEYEDFLFHHDLLTVVEWPRSLRDLISADEVLNVSIQSGTKEGPEQRKIEVRGDDRRFGSALAGLGTSC